MDTNSVHREGDYTSTACSAQHLYHEQELACTFYVLIDEFFPGDVSFQAVTRPPTQFVTSLVGGGNDGILSDRDTFFHESVGEELREAYRNASSFEVILPPLKTGEIFEMLLYQF